MTLTKPIAFLLSLVLIVGCSQKDPAGDPIAGDVASDRTEAEEVPVRGGRVHAADRATIVYESFGAGIDAVVLVHCWACSREFWSQQVEPLRAAGYRVVTLDLPGHGDAEAAPRQQWSLAGLADDVASVARTLDIERMILVGHSMGGPVSLEVAARNPGLVRGVICVDTLHDAEFEWPEGMTERLSAALESDYHGTLAGFIPSMFKPDADPAVVEWVLAQGARSDPAATIPLMRNFGEWNARDALASAGVPVRCINAAPLDGRGLPTATETNRRYADFDAVLMQGVGHYPQLERPDEFNRLLLETLRQLQLQP